MFSRVFAGTNPTAYATDYTYDAMGNILTQKRNGGGTSATALDELTYNYHTTTDGLVSNRLYQVNDVVSAGNYTDDIDDQGTFNNTHSTIETANNYGYDELGNLVRDVQEEIASIEWTVYGKMKKITRNSGSSKADMEFGYDASGNRLWKKVTPKGSGAVISTYYYLRDAQGNEMCRYVKYTNTTSQLMYVAEEHSIYGSSRVGVDNRKDTLYKAGSYSPAWGGANTSRRALGLKSFELANHLGNVLVTVSDKPVYKVSSGTIFFNPEITSTSDYYPFGAPITGRGYSSEAYRFGFGGHEKMDEVSGSGNTIDMGDRWLSVRLGRTFKIDAKSAMYPDLSPYSYAANNPIFFIDPDGKEIKPSKAFLNSSYGALYQSLYKNNSAYGKIVAKYNTSKVFNLSLNYGDKGVPSGYNAWTTTKWNYLKSNPKNITSAESNQAYAETPLIKTVTSGDYIYTYERTDIGKVRTIIHEGLHSYLGAKGIEEDDEHTTFNTYRSMMVDALKEYNTDNKLGFTDDQLNELAYLGTIGSSQFKSYIQGIADKNVTKYDDELNAFNNRISDLEYKLVKTEKVEKKTESDSTETK